MSTYNGEKYLKEQLNSLISQELKLDKILIRDDGSKDSTLDILKYYADNYNYIEYYQGENKGPAKSFWELINACEDADYYALCDQDDVWFTDKLKVAVDVLKQEGNKDNPLLYCSKYIMTDENLNPLQADISKLYNFSDFPHALLYQTAPGCTMVFNDAARKQIVKYDMDREYCIIHDSIIHKVVTMFGKMILDETPHIYYRQHSTNEIGMPRTKKEQFILRMKRFFNGKNKHYRKYTAKSLLNVYETQLDDEKKELLNMVANYDTNKDLKRKLMKEEKFKSHTINDLFFKFLVLSNYI